MPNVQAIPIIIRLKDMFLQCIKWINMQNEPFYSTRLVSIHIHMGLWKILSTNERPRLEMI